MITVDFSRLDIKPGFRILDIGCGSGRHTCAALGYNDVIVWGIDIRFDTLVEAGERVAFHQAAGEAGSGFAGFSVSDILQLPFGDGIFDLVVCSEVLEHILDHHAAVQEIARILKPGGDLIVSVPRFFPELICWSISRDYRNVSDGHIRIYKKKELTDLLEKAGLKKWAGHFAHSLHTPYWWLKCLIGPDRNNAWPVDLYHRFLIWDMMKKPWFSRRMDGLLNPFLGKSLVIYLRKEQHV